MSTKLNAVIAEMASLRQSIEQTHFVSINRCTKLYTTAFSAIAKADKINLTKSIPFDKSLEFFLKMKSKIRARLL